MQNLKDNEEGYIDDVEQTDEDAMVCLYHAYSDYMNEEQIIKEFIHIFKVSEEKAKQVIEQVKNEK